MAFETQLAQTTLEDFLKFAELPENADKILEFINGEIVEQMPGRTSNSHLGHIIVVGVHLFCREHNLPCFTSGGDGAYRIGNDVVAPDFAYKPTPMSNSYPDPVPPLLVAEIISPTDEAGNIRKKRRIYTDAGILLWELYSDMREIDVYAPGQPLLTLQADDVLDGGAVLPGFTLPLKDIFGS